LTKQSTVSTQKFLDFIIKIHNPVLSNNLLLTQLSGTFEHQTRNSILKDYEPSNLEFNYDYHEDLIVDPA
jgi:hypothetical protein